MQVPKELLQLFDEIKQVESDIDVVKAVIKSAQDEKKHLDKRAKDLRNQAILIFLKNDKKKLKQDGFTASVRMRAPKPIITDEALVPEKFFEFKKVLSKTAINDAWANGERPEGVALDNGGHVLTIKWD